MAEVLVVDDDRNFRETMRDLLVSAGYAVRVATNGREALREVQERAPAVVFCDWRMPDVGGEQFLRSLASEGALLSMPVIIMTAHGSGPTAMQAVQLGAYDFLTKPLDLDDALTIAARAVRHMELQRELERLRAQRFDGAALLSEEGTPRTNLVGQSPAWIEIFKSVGRVARTDVGVLLLGESGTGKEVVARTIHENSTRSRRPLVTVNCAALPPDLLESELFGHERGAFTSAVQQTIGRFEAADGGTVFLDEIGELPLALQPKLLRVLQEHTFERVGSTVSQHADVRIIAATNRQLEDEVKEKAFRADLFYRLNGFVIRLPPLRERRSDILPLAEHFLASCASRNGMQTAGLTEEAVLVLQGYSFSGNVRELKHLMERAAVQAGGRAITAEVLHEQLTSETPERGRSSLSDLLRLPFHESVAAWERRLLSNALEAAKGNKAEAARSLGIQRRLLYDKLQQLGLETTG